MFLNKSNLLQNSPAKIEKINSVVEAYGYADRQGYDVYWYDFGPEGIESVSVMEVSDGKCYIAIDPFKLQSEAEEMEKCLHEIGHCDSGAFYNEYATCDVRKKHENKADKHAIELRLSAKDLDLAVAEGCTELWQLAERFNITENFMRKAVCWYTHGNLSTELYF